MQKNKIEDYWGTINNWEAYRESYFSEKESTVPHRRSRWLAEIISRNPFESVLEIGSSCGRNLYHIKRMCPQARVAGIDINAQAIAFAREKVDGEFFVGSLYDLRSVIRKRYDVVFSMASLCYVLPEALSGVLDDVFSIAWKNIYHAEAFGGGVFISGETASRQFWVNDIPGYYRQKGARFATSPIPDELKDSTLQELLTCDCLNAER